MALWHRDAWERGHSIVLEEIVGEIESYMCRVVMEGFMCLHCKIGKTRENMSFWGLTI